MNLRTHKKRKRPNYKRSLILIVVLLVVIYFWLHADSLIAQFFTK